MTDISVGIHEMSNAAYHAAPGISRSGLWTIYSKTPAHFRFSVPTQKREFDIGQAAHDAILQPEIFEETAFRGPPDRRGNKWTNAVEHCEHHGLACLTSGDYDAVLRMRDAALTNATVRHVVETGIKERTAFAVDEETGVLCKCKPDIYSPALEMIVDFKTCSSASPNAAYYAIREYGYFAQESWYTYVWQQAGGGRVDAFAFLFLEKEPPFAAAFYELDPESVEEGRAVMRKALAVYAECMTAEHVGRADAWPAYPSIVQQIGLRRWDFRETNPVEDAVKMALGSIT